MIGLLFSKFQNCVQVYVKGYMSAVLSVLIACVIYCKKDLDLWFNKFCTGVVEFEKNHMHQNSLGFYCIFIYFVGLHLLI